MAASGQVLAYPHWESVIEQARSIQCVKAELHLSACEQTSPEAVGLLGCTEQLPSAPTARLEQRLLPQLSKCSSELRSAPFDTRTAAARWHLPELPCKLKAVLRRLCCAVLADTEWRPFFVQVKGELGCGYRLSRLRSTGSRRLPRLGRQFAAGTRV